LSRLWSALLLSTLLAWARPASAVTVAIVQPPHPSSVVAEVLHSLRGELLSVGLDVTMTDRPATRGLAGADSRAWLEQVAAERGASAVIDIVGDDALIAVDVWVVKAPAGRFEVTRVALEPNAKNPPERIAIRAVDALRASLLEIDLAARGRRAEASANPPMATLAKARADEPTSRRERFGLELGAAALMSLDGVGPAVLPILRVDWAARSWLVMQAGVAGLGSRPTVTTTVGNARIAQQYGILGGCFRFRSDRRLWPLFALAAGVLHTSVEGQPGLGAEAHTVDQWSFLLDGSLGAALRLYRRYYLTVAAHVQTAEPYVAIHFVDAVVATSGRPNLVLTLTVGAWL
jgi:hypothetical protein